MLSQFHSHSVCDLLCWLRLAFFAKYFSHVSHLNSSISFFTCSTLFLVHCQQVFSIVNIASYLTLHCIALQCNGIVCPDAFECVCWVPLFARVVSQIPQSTVAWCFQMWFYSMNAVLNSSHANDSLTLCSCKSAEGVCSNSLCHWNF